MKDSKQRLKNLRASRELENELSDLQKLLRKKQEEPRTGDVHIITIPRTVDDPKGFIERYKQKHSVGPRDILQILNFSSIPLDDSRRRKEKRAYKKIEAVDDDDYTDNDDPVLQDLGTQAPKEEAPVLKEQVKHGQRPARFAGRSWAEIELLVGDGLELTPEEKRWLRSKSLPGSFMPPLK